MAKVMRAKKTNYLTMFPRLDDRSSWHHHILTWYGRSALTVDDERQFGIQTAEKTNHHGCGPGTSRRSVMLLGVVPTSNGSRHVPGFGRCAETYLGRQSGDTWLVNANVSKYASFHKRVLEHSDNAHPIRCSITICASLLWAWFLSLCTHATRSSSIQLETTL